MRGVKANDRIIRQIKTEISRDLQEGLMLDEMARRFDQRHPIRAVEMTLSEFRALVEEVQQRCAG